MRWLRILLSKTTRINLLEFFYIVFELLAILLFSLIICFGLYQFAYCIYVFLFRADTRGDTELLIRGLLSAFEIFFLSPVPLLIIASFKAIIIKMYPMEVKINRSTLRDMIKEIDAKKTFISSLIGVTSTFLLGQFIEGLGNKDGSSQVSFSANSDYFILLIIAIVFLIIQIALYALLAAHSPKDGSESGQHDD